MPACRVSIGAIAATMMLSAAIAGPAFADDPPIATAVPTQDRLTFAIPIEGLGPAMDPVALDGYRGGDDSVENTVRIRGTVDGNTAQDTISGSNAITGDAFSNASGISTVIQNSGSNVLIQNGMVVNVQFVGAGP